MSVNKFLCKYFDWERKGYVTLSEFIGILFFYLGVSSLFIYSAYRAVLIAINNDWNNPEAITVLNPGMWFISLILIVIIITIIFVVAAIYQYLSTIKIAKCERKRDD